MRNLVVAVVASSVLTFTLSIQLAQAQSFKILHRFTGGEDGGNPTGYLTFDPTSNVYGTTYSGGHSPCPPYRGCGIAYKFSPSSRVIYPLYNFLGGTDGAVPSSGLVFGPDGALYGTTEAGGNGQGYGTIYNLTAAADACKSVLCPWTETVLYRFLGKGDGWAPIGNLVFDKNSNLYGTTQYGGLGWGVVYEMPPPFNSFPMLLHSFWRKGDGLNPSSGPVFDNSGNLYGLTYFGGNSYGTIYQLSPSGSYWVETILYSFTCQSDGCYPSGDLVLDPSGNLYGTTASGGSGGSGTVWELTPSNGHWIFTVLYSFHFIGFGPNSLTRDKDGNLYGTTQNGGSYLCGGFSCGTVFKLAPSSGGWIYTDLHDFTGQDGAYGGSVTVDANGNLYGTTLGGAEQNPNCYGGCGVLWEITPQS